MTERFQRFALRAQQIRQEMWKAPSVDRTRKQTLLYATLRVAAITWAGIGENRIGNRAAALSFSSMLGLAPMIALIVLLSGFIVERIEAENENFLIENINEAINFIAPQTTVDAQSNEWLNSLIGEIISQTQSGVFGTTSVVLLMLVVIQLFTSIENAFNDIWGVRKGRSWVTRIGMYWTVITLGTVLVLAGVAIVIPQIMAKFNVATEWLPGSEFGSFVYYWGTRLISVAMIASVLAVFYHFVPNTIVNWKAAFIGAAITVICLLVNNSLAFLYVRRVTLEVSLYGQVGILLVLMFGIYFFWFFLLLGGRVTYAVQNARFKSNKIAWDELSIAAQESLSLLVFTAICRKFRACEPPLKVVDIAEKLSLPIQIIHAALNRLCDIGLATSIPPKENEHYQAYRYQPAKPLDKIKLLDFKYEFEGHGDEPDEDRFAGFDPIVKRFHETLDAARASSFGEATFETVLKEFDDSSSVANIPQIEPELKEA